MAHIELIAAMREQEPVLANLLELYVYDFSEFVDVELRADGRFGYERLSLYWSEVGRYPFLVKVDGRLAGFVFVKRGSEFTGRTDVWEIAEFFIVRGCRRRGVGIEVAQRVWRMFPGQWEVRVMEANEAARRFWERAVGRFAGEAMVVEREGRMWRVFSFDAAREAKRDSHCTFFDDAFPDG